MNLGQFLLIVGALTQGTTTTQRTSEEQTEQVGKVCYAPPCATPDWNRVEFEVTGNEKEKQFAWCTLVPPGATRVMEEILQPSVATAAEESKKARKSRISGQRLSELLEQRTHERYCAQRQRFSKNYSLPHSQGRGKQRYANQ